MEQQIQEIQELHRILDLPAGALSPDNFVAALNNAITEFQRAEEVQLSIATLEDGKHAHTMLSFLKDVFDILQDEILEQRDLTAEESELLAELDKQIGRGAHRVTKIVRGLKQFEAIGQHDSLYSVH